MSCCFSIFSPLHSCVIIHIKEGKFWGKYKKRQMWDFATLNFFSCSLSLSFSCYIAICPTPNYFFEKSKERWRQCGGMKNSRYVGCQKKLKNKIFTGMRLRNSHRLLFCRLKNYTRRALSSASFYPFSWGFFMS